MMAGCQNTKLTYAKNHQVAALRNGHQCQAVYQEHLHYQPSLRPSYLLFLTVYPDR
ncbi:hypothetical protein L798_15630 [Zootermopsis nevadensis]|uniref:Uncharacterized protein n=1 Tax=Zootermopsis nevadensis TaxID=136037 RepID=A0A067QKN5_ZOONE|nr:hypothetical protein L798_15630 [Zootermopsis nevadensis]